MSSVEAPVQTGVRGRPSTRLEHQIGFHWRAFKNNNRNLVKNSADITPIGYSIAPSRPGPASQARVLPERLSGTEMTRRQAAGLKVASTPIRRWITMLAAEATSK